MEVSAALLDFYLSKLNVNVSKPSARAPFFPPLPALLGLVRAHVLPRGGVKVGFVAVRKSCTL